MNLPIQEPKIALGGRRCKYQTDPEIDEALRVAYAKGIVPGVTLTALSKRFARSKSWLKARALKLGVVVVRVKAPDWSDDEIEALCGLGHFHPRVIAKKLVQRGFPRRTATGIKIKLTRNNIGCVMARQDAGWYSSIGLGRLVGRDGKCVVRWIEAGWLKAERQHTERTAAQGDHWLIHEQDIRAMAERHAENMDFGRWNRRFLADCLINPKPRPKNPGATTKERTP